MVIIIVVVACAFVQISTGQVIPFNDTEKRAFVDIHNNYRKGEGATNMKRIYWNNDLQRFAEKTAANCDGHSKNRGNVGGFGYVGECISNGQTPQPVIDQWFSEKPDYIVHNGTCRGSGWGHGECGHYLQVVWADTSDIGCGLAKCPNGCHLLACEYGPGGNVVINGRRVPYTQGKPGSQCSIVHNGTIADEDGLCVVPGRAKYGDIDNAACQNAKNKSELVWLWVLVICWYFMCH